MRLGCTKVGLKSAGVKIEDEQKSVRYNFDGSTLEGRYDVKIDKKVFYYIVT